MTKHKKSTAENLWTKDFCCVTVFRHPQTGNFTTVRRLPIKHPSGNCQQFWFKACQATWNGCWQVAQQKYKGALWQCSELNVLSRSTCRKYFYSDMHVKIITLKIASLTMLINKQTKNKLTSQSYIGLKSNMQNKTSELLCDQLLRNETECCPG